MLINLTGSPCSGKSTLASTFVKQHPEFTHLSIDDFRIQYKEEDTAWYELMCAAAAAKHSILESSGLSWRIEPHFLQHPTIARRGCLTIVLYGQQEVFHQRLLERKKPEVPFKWKGLTQEGLINACLKKLPEKYPSAYFLETDDEEKMTANYREFEEVILHHKIQIDKHIVK